MEMQPSDNNEAKTTANFEVFSVESPSKLDNNNDQILADNPASAHTIGNDTWQQVGLMMATAFNCGWILSFSSLMVAPLGWTWAITCMIFFGYFTLYSNWLLADFHYLQGRRFIRYRDIMGFLFGREMYYVTWGFQCLTMLLGNMGFILLGGRALKEMILAFDESITMRLQYFIIITGVTYCIFALVVPNLSAMRVWLGASAVLTFGYITVLFVALLLEVKSKSTGPRHYEVKGNKVERVFNAFGAIAAIFVCNTSGMLLEIQSTLQKPAVKNMRKALYVQFSGGLILYYGVSFAGYWIYGSQVSDYLPKELTGPKWAKILINAAVFLQNTISQHMFIQPVHEALDTSFLKLDENTNSKQNIKRRFLLRATLFTLNTIVTAAIPFMGDFINLLGSFTFIPLTFLFPSMIYIKVKRKTARIGPKIWHWAIIVAFTLYAVAATVSAMRLIINNVKNYHLFANQ